VGRKSETQFDSQFAYAAKLFRVVEEVDPVREKYPMLFLTARAPAIAICQRKYSSTWWKRIVTTADGWSSGEEHRSLPLCTNCRNRPAVFLSAEKGKTGRMMGVVGIRA